MERTDEGERFELVGTVEMRRIGKKDRKLNAKTGFEARGLVRWRGTDVTAEGPDEGNPEKDGAPLDGK